MTAKGTPSAPDGWLASCAYADANQKRLREEAAMTTEPKLEPCPMCQCYLQRLVVDGKPVEHQGAFVMAHPNNECFLWETKIISRRDRAAWNTRAPSDTATRAAILEEAAKVADGYADSASRLLGDEATRSVQAAQGIAGRIRSLSPAQPDRIQEGE